jgi:hypothetical protein
MEYCDCVLEFSLIIYRAKSTRKKISNCIGSYRVDPSGRDV